MQIDKIKAGIERQIQARPWLDHLVRAGGRYNRQRGDYYAAGITYFTVLSLFPLLMVAFAIAGFVLHSHPESLGEIQQKVIENIPGEFGDQVNDLIEQAVDSRGTVGILGLLGAFYAGLGWMANLRAALTEQWEQKTEQANWFLAKLSDLGALVGLALAFGVSLGLSALSSSNLGKSLLSKLGLADLPGARLALSLVSLVLALLATWAVFAWIIARLPREPISLASAAKAGLMAAVAFEIFKFVASLYLRTVLRSPAGATFGSIIGLMVFSYVTYRIILFATAWAAEASENTPTTDESTPTPAPAIIRPRVITPTLPKGTGLALFSAGALTTAVLSALSRRRR
ncbi:inner membrane protein YhjD [Nocardia sp. XZ_19_385]|uniref:inner membrane protein YhjD n=1 Tax=Nocardia sp. XZ_19_385 TaxID=2769488 RepID=UPI0028168B4A|nr:inner membrane protein YhjD [Nocardia sp. XZ_19_385]